MCDDNKKSFCDYCGNPLRNKVADTCKDMSCYWFSHWQVDKTDPESIKKANDIRAEIADINW